MDRYQKQRIAARYWLLGRGFTDAVGALNVAEEYHNGVRKDGITPEFAHQIEIFHYVRTLPGLMFPQETFTTVFLHDVAEDYDVSVSKIKEMYGEEVSIAVERLTKKNSSMKKDLAKMFADMATNPIASIVKGADRVHNLQSMLGVFTPEKQIEYAEEVNTHFMPMLKQASKIFPEQERAYENIRHMLRSQVELIRAIHTHTDIK